MAILVPTQNNVSVGIRHKIAAASQFTGAASGGSASKDGLFTEFASSTAGGLFNFEQTQSIVAHTLRANFGTSIAHAVYIVKVDAAGAEVAGSAIQIFSATAAFLNLTSRIVLPPGQALKLTTTGATLAMTAEALAVQELGYPG
jgi:hypothetical protein